MSNINNNDDFQKSILPDTGFLRISDVLKFIPVSPTTWWNGVKSGKFPKPVELGSKTTAWRAEDIHTLIKEYSEK